MDWVAVSGAKTEDEDSIASVVEVETGVEVVE